MIDLRIRQRFLWLTVALAVLLLTPAAACARATSGPGIALLSVSQKAILSTKSIAVRVTYRAPGGLVPNLRVGQYETTGGTTGQTMALAPRQPMSLGRVTVLLSKTGVATLSLCAARRIVVELELHQHVFAITSRKLNIDAPQCLRFFSPTSFWNTPLAARAPLDPTSPTLSGALLTLVRSEEAANSGPTINTTKYSVPIYTVPLTQPLTPVVLDRTASWANGLRAIFAAGIPIPPGARPAAGTDAQLVIWQPAADRMWELWVARNVGQTWHAQWGGYMSHVDSNPGVFPSRNVIPEGATATGLPLVGGLITLADLRRGVINHALAFAVPDTRAGYWSLPAQRTDGRDSTPDSIPSGARFRLPASLHIASLHLPRLIRMMAYAVQKYGMIVRDTAATTVFYGEDPTPSGSTAWKAALSGTPLGSSMARFPWQDLVLLKMRLQTYRTAGRALTR